MSLYPSCRSSSFGTRLGAKLHFAGLACLRVGSGARSARRHAIRAKCNFAHKCGPKLERGTEEKDGRRLVRHIFTRDDIPAVRARIG